jgi:hypothetical protein
MSRPALPPEPPVGDRAVRLRHCIVQDPGGCLVCVPRRLAA